MLPHGRPLDMPLCNMIYLAVCPMGDPKAYSPWNIALLNGWVSRGTCHIFHGKYDGCPMERTAYPTINRMGVPWYVLCWGTPWYAPWGAHPWAYHRVCHSLPCCMCHGACYIWPSGSNFLIGCTMIESIECGMTQFHIPWAMS